MTEGEPRLDFRDMTEADLADGLRLSRASGWNQTLADWRVLLSLGPGLFRVGLLDGRVVASGGAVRYGDALAWICMILVDPERARPRRRDADLRRGARPLRGRGAGRAPAVRGPRRDAGRPRASTAARLRGGGGSCGCAPSRRPNGRGQVLNRACSRAGHDSRPDPRRPRRPCWPATARCSAPTGAPVLRWALASAPDLARVVREGTAAEPTASAATGITPTTWARSWPRTARARSRLVRACLSLPRRRPLILDARAEPLWLAELGALGFREQRPFTRMYLGDARPPARPALETAVFGPEFG